MREPIPGLRRFQALIDGRPAISTNVLTHRVKQLEAIQLFGRRVLAPVAGASVNELTEDKQAFEPMLIKLGRSGRQFVPFAPGDAALLHAAR